MSKAIDKAAGAEREITGTRPQTGAKFALTDQLIANGGFNDPTREGFDITTPATDAARQWDGWGTALKPAYEPIVLARKPLVGTVAANVQQHDTGALNIDGCLINTVGDEDDRWPANLILDGEGASLLDTQAGDNRSRFFYTAKSSRSEREAGLEGFAPERRSDGRAKDIENPRLRTSTRRNDHPTVKPIDLMRYLCRLITPPGGLVLDPFCGSGSTGMAALDEGFRFIGVDLDAHYAELANARISHRHTYKAEPDAPTETNPQPRLF